MREMKFSPLPTLIWYGLGLVASIRVGRVGEPNAFRVAFRYEKTSYVTTQGPQFVLEVKNSDDSVTRKECGAAGKPWGNATWGEGWLTDGLVSPIASITVRRGGDSQPTYQTLVRAAPYVHELYVSGYRIELISTPEYQDLIAEAETDLRDLVWPTEVFASEQYQVTVRIVGSTSHHSRRTVVQWSPRLDTRWTISNVDLPYRLPHQGTLPKGTMMVAWPMSRPQNGCKFNVGSAGDERGAIAVHKCRLDTNSSDHDWTMHWVVFTSVKMA